MELQLVLGSSGAGKSYGMYQKVIEAAAAEKDTNYIVLVPEQYSMAIQRKMVELSPVGGYMNIDVIGFNRLAYRLFDEQNIKPKAVLEDFGKTMMLKVCAGRVADRLEVFGGALEKNGFIDEVKSLMSELYQYAKDKEKLTNVIDKIKQKDGEDLLCKKLQDMKLIFEEFDKGCAEAYIVAEQLTELLADAVEKSQLVARSVVVMDSFTGFTPLQYRVVRALMRRAKKVYGLFTIDRAALEKKLLSQHELFYLTKETIQTLVGLAEEDHVPVAKDIYVPITKESRYGEQSAIAHLEKNIFRYPYKTWKGEQDEIHIWSCESMVKELTCCGEEILRLVQEEGYRYKDIAVICGDLETRAPYVKQCFGEKIPVFLDKTEPIKNNACLDSLGHMLRICEDNFTYESVFAFLKTGVFTELDATEVDMMENYVLARGLVGHKAYEKAWKDEYETYRALLAKLIMPVYKVLGGTKKRTVETYVKTIKEIMEKLGFEEKLAELPGVYDKLTALLDKLLEIMAREELTTEEFRELMDVGLSELTLGRIPSRIDMVIFGDITRTRLDEIKVLFVLGVNDGVIPARGDSPGIINDREKERLKEEGFVLAPTDTENAYTEQFYLYRNLTLPSEKLYLSYANKEIGGGDMRPSYIISRVQAIYPELQIERSPEKAGLARLTHHRIERIAAGLHKMVNEKVADEETLAAIKLMLEQEDKEDLARLYDAVIYSNVPKRLAEDVRALIKLKQMWQSVSRLEKFASCAYAYYLAYTIGLRERRTAAVDSRDTGIVLHNSLKLLFEYVKEEKNNDWASLTEETVNGLMDGYVEESFQEEFGEWEAEQEQLDHLKGVLKRISRRTAKVFTEACGKENFVPTYIEHRFKEELTFDGNQKVNINGIVDRADICYDPDGTKLYLRIIDYKSGGKKYEVSDVYEGLSLQLSIYMEVMRSLAGRDAGEDKQVIPDGMYYYHMYDPFVNAKNLDAAEKERAKNLKIKGLSYDDDPDFDLVLKYADKKAGEIASRIAGGEIQKRPIENGQNTPCNYCTYKDVCRFDEKYGGNKMRYREFKVTDRNNIKDAMRKACGGKKDGLDT